MASCFGHTGVAFDAENDRPVPCSLQCHFEAARGRFLRLRAAEAAWLVNKYMQKAGEPENDVASV